MADKKAMSGGPGPAVRVTGLEKRFGNFVAVNRISFEVPWGEVFGFLGPNGAGKSTTIRMLCGVLEPSGGSGAVAGFDVRRERESIKERIGYMSQRFSLYDDLTVEENLNFYAGIYGVERSMRGPRKDWALEMSGLGSHRGAGTSTLATGLKQRLALACAVLHEPRVLFLDEPTSGVDPRARRRFWDLIYELSGRGTTVFVTTHYMDEAEYCDRIGLIYRGDLVAAGSPEELKRGGMEGTVLEVSLPRPQDVLETIAGAPGVHDAALFGGTVHAVVEDAEPGRDAIVRALACRGATPERIVEIPPSLEDVFVSLIEARDREEGALLEVDR